MPFQADFGWGAATASYQIEGAVAADGRGLSVWDVFAGMPGKTWGGDTGAVACDHYHRYAEDVAIMRYLGLKSYRFSIAWPRIQPEGVGEANEAGLAFYDRLVDALLEANITPYATLYHWDMPYALYQRGGWMNRDSAAWFGDYAAIMGERLGDRVKHWWTLNEPSIFTGLGHQIGIHAPGDKLSRRSLLAIVHNVLRAHGLAAQALRAARADAIVGIAPTTDSPIPVSDAPADVAAARTAYEGIHDPDDVHSIQLWLDPILKGAYPDPLPAAWEGLLPAGFEADMATIAQPLDMLGLNIYRGYLRGVGADGQPTNLPFAFDLPRTMMAWPVTPDALYWGPKFLYERYGVPIMITENGIGTTDWVGIDGHVHDGQRIDFLHRHLRALERAVDEGVDVRGYFQWSLLDNFEWAEGYRIRFGLVHVDYTTQQRTLKDSALWYRRVIESNGALLRGM
jgi:beta-glucosidase